MTTATKLPTEDRPMSIDPDLAAALEKELAPLSGEALTRAQDAIQRVRASALTGSFGKIVQAYRDAIAEAVAPAESAS